MKNAKQILLAAVTVLLSVGALAQVIDEKAWDEVDKDKRVGILTQYFSIDSCRSLKAQRVAAEVYPPQGPNDDAAYVNQTKLYKALSASKEFSAAAKAYCAGKFFAEQESEK